MTTITKYVCDLCGKTFENEDECQQHELLEKFGCYASNVVFFDAHKNVITASQVINQLFDPWAIFIGDEKAIPFIEEIYDFCGFYSPWCSEGNNNRKATGFYIYDEDIGWYRPADKIEELERKMKEYGVDA